MREIDPVCGMVVDPEKAADRVVHQGLTFHFCGKGCANRFRSEPGKYFRTPEPGALQPAPAAPQTGVSAQHSESSTPALTGSAAPPARAAVPLTEAPKRVYVCPMDADVRSNSPGPCPKCGMALEPLLPPVLPAKTQYTCPMHPEIIRQEAGACPICGMALEPRLATLAEEPNIELRDMTRRFWVAVALSIPVLLLGMSDLLSGNPVQGALGMRALEWIELALATPVVLWSGWPFFQRGWASLVNRSPNMFTLVALGTGTAYLYSVLATLAPGIFPQSFHAADGAVPVYFEAASVITSLVLLGQVLEIRARSRTSQAIRALLDLAPKEARRIENDGGEHDVPLDQVVRGDRLRVRPGEKVPVDGIVLEGSSAVDESMVSGEPIAIEKAASSRVIGGTLNGTGSFVMRAERVGSETLLAQIVQLVSEAQRSRAPIQRIADVVSAYFVPIVLGVALVTFIVWSIVGPHPRMAYALVNAVAVLIIACPCALGLATPMAIMVGTGRGATAGVLVRNAAALQILGKVDTVVVDKTGTLTEGKPRLTSVSSAKNFSETDVLRIAAAMEAASEHPLAEAVLAGARERGAMLGSAKVENFQAMPGKGITGNFEGRAVALGNTSLLESLGVTAKQWSEQAESLRHTGHTVLFLSADGQLAGLLAVKDPVKKSAPEAIRRLHQAGLHVVMLSGDNRTTAAAVGRELGIDQVEAEVLPAQKSEVIARLQDQGHIVAMAGDGINDAPALAQADAGIAMGTGADVAIESAGIILVKGDLNGVVRARELSRATMRNIHQNLFFAFIYNTIGVPIAAGVLYPLFGLLLSPIIASAAMTFSSVSVIANALRLQRLKLA